MVLAFGKLSSATGGGADPQALAGDISLALYTTADGLIIAIPLTIVAGMLQVRLSRLTDRPPNSSANSSRTCRTRWPD